MSNPVAPNLIFSRMSRDPLLVATSFLTKKDLGSFARVNSLGREIVQLDRESQTALDLFHSNLFCASISGAIIQHPRITSLTLNYLPFSVEDPVVFWTRGRNWTMVHLHLSESIDVSASCRDQMNLVAERLERIVTLSLKGNESPYLIGWATLCSSLVSLDLSYSTIDDGVLIHILRANPNLRSLDLRGCPNITHSGIRALSVFVTGKKMVKIDLSADYNQLPSVVYPTSLARSREIQELLLSGQDPSVNQGEMSFMMPMLNVDEGYMDPDQSIEQMIALGASVRNISNGVWDLLIEQIDFSEMEYFDLSNTSYKVNEERAVKITKKLAQSTKLAVCPLSIPFPWLVSVPVMQDLLEALPISTMRKLDLNAPFNAEQIALLARQLALNSNLESLYLKIRPHPDDDLNPESVTLTLIESLNAPTLSHLLIQTGLPADPLIAGSPLFTLLSMKLPSWPKLNFLNIGSLTGINPETRQLTEIYH
jgi:hypothetical protein